MNTCARRGGSPSIQVCILILIVLMAAACSKEEASGPSAAAKPSKSFGAWIPYASEEGGFSVFTPSLFRTSTESTPTDAGDIQFIRYTAQPDSRHIYLIVISQMPEALLAGRDPRQMLQGAREGVIGQFQGTISSERQIVLDGNAGLEMKLNGSSQGMSVSVVSRVFLVKSRMIQIYAIAEKGYEDPAAFQYFLDSFKLN